MSNQVRGRKSMRRPDSDEPEEVAVQPRRVHALRQVNDEPLSTVVRSAFVGLRLAWLHWHGHGMQQTSLQSTVFFRYLKAELPCNALMP